ncbi:hypothetical protein [Mucilaginibacter sp. OK098]|uniref:hypothetical protein n=1 Tax=Mucilaginibacter sp. OK098 TaxID=1855297 RepID=UPI00090FE386|nr:hypothetical protein [Mucilaginibacter sp. OK098]SHN24939.1 hypothetical protein SAMN05216524_107222 [Mucilaginibacter sp. OK098]
MKNLITITILLLSASLLTKAQDTTKVKAQPDSVIKMIPFGEGKHSSYLFTIGGKLQTPEDIKIRLLSYAPSAAEYSIAKNSATWGYISWAGFGASSIAAVIVFATHNKHTGETTGFVNGQPAFIYQHHSQAGAYILTGVATAFLTSAIINLVKAGKHGNRALKLYNQRFE